MRVPSAVRTSAVASGSGRFQRFITMPIRRNVSSCPDPDSRGHIGGCDYSIHSHIVYWKYKENKPGPSVGSPTPVNCVAQPQSTNGMIMVVRFLINLPQPLLYHQTPQTMPLLIADWPCSLRVLKKTRFSPTTTSSARPSTVITEFISTIPRSCPHRRVTRVASPSKH